MQIRPEIPKQYVCSTSAKLDYPKYALTDPPEDPEAFEFWKLDIIKKYPLVLKSHKILWECYSYYKAKEDKAFQEFTNKKAAP